MRRHIQRGFSLIEVMVGAAILLVSGLAVTYMLKSEFVGQTDSLKACQDINEEVLAQINSLGTNSFAETYGVANNSGYTYAVCPPGKCTPELNISHAVRWPPTARLRSGAPVSPTAHLVQPYFLKNNSINFLQAIYNADAGFCQGRDIARASNLNLISQNFGPSGESSSIVMDRERYINTQMRIVPFNILTGADTACIRPLHIRPRSARSGDTPPALQQNLVAEAAAARTDLGFHVTVTSNYTDPNTGQAQQCASEMRFFYQPETYSGTLSYEPPENPNPLPACNTPKDRSFDFTTKVAKKKKDSVLMCRSRGADGAFTPNPSLCVSGNPDEGSCVCDPENRWGCPNTWFVPPALPASTLADPKSWFPCDRLHSVLSQDSKVQQTRVTYLPEGNGAYEFRFIGVQELYQVVIDVAEVDSAMNMTGDQAGEPLSTFILAHKGREPGSRAPEGRICTGCGKLPNFMCRDECPTVPELCEKCPGYSSLWPCECPDTRNTCACEEYYASHRCECDAGYRAAHPCECIDGYAEAHRCECLNLDCPCDDPESPLHPCPEKITEPELCEGGGGGGGSPPVVSCYAKDPIVGYENKDAVPCDVSLTPVTMPDGTQGWRVSGDSGMYAGACGSRVIPASCSPVSTWVGCGN